MAITRTIGPTPCTRRAGARPPHGGGRSAAHPLYAQGRGFVPAGDLRPGDVLRDADGPAARVIRVRPAGRARTVHNIEVDTTHAHCVATTTGTWKLIQRAPACISGKRYYDGPLP